MRRNNDAFLYRIDFRTHGIENSPVGSRKPAMGQKACAWAASRQPGRDACFDH